MISVVLLKEMFCILCLSASQDPVIDEPVSACEKLCGDAPPTKSETPSNTEPETTAIPA